MFFFLRFVPEIASTHASQISVEAALLRRRVALILTFLTWASSVMTKITKRIVSLCIRVNVSMWCIEVDLWPWQTLFTDIWVIVSVWGYTSSVAGSELEVWWVELRCCTSAQLPSDHGHICWEAWDSQEGASAFRWEHRCCYLNDGFLRKGG